MPISERDSPVGRILKPPADEASAGRPEPVPEGFWKGGNDAGRDRLVAVLPPERDDGQGRGGDRSGERRATELPRWEWKDSRRLVVLDADGNLKTGLFYDSAYRGWFYLDQKNGLKTGWVLIDGEWRYFEPSCPVTEGRMVSGYPD